MNRSKLTTFSGLMKIFIKFISLTLLICLVVVLCGCENKEIISYNFETYLSGDSGFEKKFLTIMPTKNELADSKIIYYSYYNNGKDSFTFENGMIRLTVKYSNDKLVNESQRLEGLYEANDSVMNGQFYYNGILYKAFGFYDDAYEDGALAYHICSDSSTISYIAFTCYDLAYMSVESALSIFPQIPYEDRVTQYDGSSS